MIAALLLGPFLPCHRVELTLASLHGDLFTLSASSNPAVLSGSLRLWLLASLGSTGPGSRTPSAPTLVRPRQSWSTPRRSIPSTRLSIPIPRKLSDIPFTTVPRADILHLGRPATHRHPGVEFDLAGPAIGIRKIFNVLTPILEPICIIDSSRQFPNSILLKS